MAITEKNCTVVITTFFSDEKLNFCLSNIPEAFPIIVIDNGCDHDKKNFYEKKYKNLRYIIPKENLGVPRSYSYAFSLVKTRYMFNTQPDVTVKKNCIENLLNSYDHYPNAAILSPIIFHEGKYLVDGDYKTLKLKNKKLINPYINLDNSLNWNPPSGDLSVDAVTGTAMLIDTYKLKDIKDWDTKIFNYYEDMDLCLRLRLHGYEIIKIKNAEVDHQAFSSHDLKFEDQLNFSRNWHYSWSSFYFFKKHIGKIYAYRFGLKLFFISFFKFIFYFCILKKKYKTHLAKSWGVLYSMLNFNPSFRPKI